jgi:threonine/homoserine/homoserine lactone efflux protein
VSRTLQGGARAGAAAALGISAGCVVHALAAAFGLAALLALHPQAFRAIQWAGAAYLVWLGLGLWRGALAAGADGAGGRTAPAGDAAPARTAWADFRTGVLTNVLNPKVALFFLAFLPQFVPAGSPSKTASFLLLGAWFVVQGTLFLLALVLLAARLRRLSRNDVARRWLQGLGGGLFVALAAKLVLDQPAGA